MHKYLSNALLYLSTVIILLICLGAYFGVNSAEEFSQLAVSMLPFGKKLWEIYLRLPACTGKQYTGLAFCCF